MAKNMIIEHFICFRKVLIIVGEQKKFQQNWAKIGKDMALQTSEFFIFIHKQKFFANFYESIRWSRGSVQDCDALGPGFETHAFISLTN